MSGQELLKTLSGKYSNHVNISMSHGHKKFCMGDCVTQEHRIRHMSRPLYDAGHSRIKDKLSFAFPSNLPYHILALFHYLDKGIVDDAN